MDKKRDSVLVVSRWSIPARNPRAFRTTELINELSRRGYNISAFLPDYATVDDSITVYPVKAPVFNHNEKNFAKHNHVKALLANAIRKASIFFLGETPGNVIYSFRLMKKLKKILKKNSYEAIISISYPFYVHLAVALCRWLSANRDIVIADCGDPFYDNPSCCKAPYLKQLEKKVLRCFDYVAIPVETARKSYADYALASRLRIIPQGFAITQIADDAYRKNHVPRFCFAGVFYEKIRNPRYFFNYLVLLKQDFVFVVYALPDVFTLQLLEEYKEKLGDRLEIREPLPREKLIHVIATMEFVVNIDNENSNQKPSKLIDYAMSKRPILSFNSRTFKPKVFEEFLQGNYAGQEQIDLSQYDICNVVDKFEELFAEIR